MKRRSHAHRRLVHRVHRRRATVHHHRTRIHRRRTRWTSTSARRRVNLTRR